MSTSTLKLLLAQPQWELSPETQEKVAEFYEIVLQENAQQNLTRLTLPEDFFYGHVVDVIELLRWKGLNYPALDLGSGVGVPGILAALISNPSMSASWILS